MFSRNMFAFFCSALSLLNLTSCSSSEQTAEARISSESTVHAVYDTEAKQSQLILSPQQTQGEESLFIIIPGVNRSPAQYKSLATTIQSSHPNRLWVAIVPFFANLTNPLQAETGIDGIMNRVRSMGFKDLTDEKTIIAGHSMGGIIAQGLAKKRNFRASVLLSSYLMRTNGTSTFPEFNRNVLIISGELDGQTRLTRIALDAFAEDQSHSYSSKREKYVILLPGINHAQFASGERTPSDLEPDTSYENAQSEIAATVSEFLLQVDSDRDLNSQQRRRAATRLAHRVQTSRSLLTPYWKASELDNDWCRQSQMSEIPNDLPAADFIVSQDSFKNVIAFARSKPSIQSGPDNNMRINVSFFLKYKRNPIDISTIPESVQEIACKMKSREAILASAREEPMSEVSCADRNREVYQWALDQISEAARNRFFTRGRQLNFTNDRIVGSGIQWISSALTFENSANESTTTVTSTTLRTSTQVPVGLGGMHYCKLLSPTRAMEWILVDGLRKGARTTESQ